MPTRPVGIAPEKETFEEDCRQWNAVSDLRAFAREVNSSIAVAFTYRELIPSVARALRRSSCVSQTREIDFHRQMKEELMIHRHSRARRSVLTLASLFLVAASGCAVARSPGTPTTPAAVVLPADARAFAYGATIEQVLQNPDLGPRIRGLFGADWTGATAGSTSRLEPGAELYFEQGGPVRMIRIENTDYIAVSSCVPHDCDRRNVLVLIEQGGARLYGRLDEGGFVHYYSYGPGVARDTAGLLTDTGFRALRQGRPSYAGL